MHDVAFFFAGGTLIAAIAFLIRRLGYFDGGADWIGAWTCLLIAGLDILYVPATSIFNVVSPLWDHLFATFLLSGTLRFVGLQRYLPNLFSISAVVVLARLTIQPFLWGGVGVITAALVIIASSVACVYLLYHHGNHQRLNATRLLGPVFFAPALGQSVYTYSSITGLAPTGAFFIYLMCGIALAMVQVLLLIEKSRRAAEVSRDTLALLAQSAPIGLCLTTPDGSISALNDSAREILNLAPQPAPPTISELIHAASDDTFGVIAEERTQEATLRLNHDVTVMVRKQALDVDGRRAGDIWFFEDITANEQLKDLLPRAQHVRDLTNVAVNIGHIFNNKLMAISGNTELIASAGHNDIQQYVSGLMQATDETAEVVQDFLRLSKYEAPTEETVSVKPVLESVCAESPLDIHLAVDAVDGIGIASEEAAFRRVFEELLTNAVDAGATSVDITGSVNAQGLVELSVADNGRGINESTLNKVFEPFFTTKTGNLGYGLGLPIVRGIVTAHGGNVDIVRAEEGVDVRTRWTVVTQG